MHNRAIQLHHPVPQDLQLLEEQSDAPTAEDAYQPIEHAHGFRGDSAQMHKSTLKLLLDKLKRRYTLIQLECLSHCALHLGLFTLSLLRMLFACTHRHVLW